LQKHGHSALGVDVSLAALKTAREEGSGLAVAQSAAEQLPFADGALDAIFAECVLSVFADAARALREFARILRMGGWLVASDIYARGTEENIIAQMEACGFSVTTFEDHTPALKRFAAQLIWENFPLPVRAAEGGQMSGLFCALPPKPGYYLLVAQRSGAILDFGAGARQRLAPALHVQTHGDQT
jgi:ubiquinone/menaquinone biosynthesis C-methylase UbiE